MSQPAMRVSVEEQSSDKVQKNNHTTLRQCPEFYRYLHLINVHICTLRAIQENGDDQQIVRTRLSPLKSLEKLAQEVMYSYVFILC